MTNATREHSDAALQLRPASSFFGAPVADIEDLAPGAIAALGVYCDHFSNGQPGGRFAARQLRYASTVAWPSGLGPSRTSQAVVDLGDFNVFPLEPGRTLETLSEQSQRVVTTGAKLFAIGGDYSVSPAVFQGIARHYGESNLAIIRLSRRLDLLPVVANQTGAPARGHATTKLSALLPGGLSAVALLGGRGAITLEEREHASAAIVISASEMDSAPAQAVRAARTARDQLERCAERFYLSVDADVLAPRFGAVALPTTRGGLSLAQLLAVLTELDDLPFVGAELTGHIPDLDVPGRAMTSLIAGIGAKILECLAGRTKSCR